MVDDKLSLFVFEVKFVLLVKHLAIPAGRLFLQPLPLVAIFVLVCLQHEVVADKFCLDGHVIARFQLYDVAFNKCVVWNLHELIQTFSHGIGEAGVTREWKLFALAVLLVLRALTDVKMLLFGVNLVLEAVDDSILQLAVLLKQINADATNLHPKV